MAKKKKAKQTIHWYYLMGLISLIIILNGLFIIRYVPPKHVCYYESPDSDDECTAFCVSLPEEDLMKYSEDCGLESKEIVGTCMPNNRCDCTCVYKPLSEGVGISAN